jgi:hypothetical protein
MFGIENGKETVKGKSTGPVKTGNTDEQANDDKSIKLPNGCDQDFVYYED